MTSSPWAQRILFSGMICIYFFCGANVYFRYFQFPEFGENRFYSQWPQKNMFDSQGRSDFFRELEIYAVEHFSLRRAFTLGIRTLEYKLFGRMDHHFLQTSDGFMLSQVNFDTLTSPNADDPNYISQFADYFKRRKEEYKNSGIRSAMFIVPARERFFGDTQNLNPRHLKMAGDGLLKTLHARFPKEVPDIYSLQRSLIHDRGPAGFIYKTDNHWTYESARIAVEKFLFEEYQFSIDPYDLKKDPIDLVGSFVTISGLYMWESVEQTVYKEYGTSTPLLAKDFPGLQGEELLFEQVNFLNSKTKKTLLVVGDSFSLFIIPPLGSYFANIYYLRLNMEYDMDNKKSRDVLALAKHLGAAQVISCFGEMALRPKFDERVIGYLPENIY